MRLVQITAGTGDFYCGNCVRDNALVNALNALGHEALMLPLYLPMVTDESAIRKGTPILFGGINVYLQQKSAFFRNTPRWVDALLDSEFLLRKAAQQMGMTKARELGELTVSTLQGENGKQIKELKRLVDWLREYGKPEVVCLSNALLMGLGKTIRHSLGVPVVGTLQGEDGFLDALPSPYREQAWETLRDCCRGIEAFIPVSRYYGEVMSQRLNLPADKVHVVHNGISLAGYLPPAPRVNPPVLGYLARMCSDKGLSRLVTAFIRLKQRNRIPGLRFHIGGTMTRSDEPFVNRIKQQLGTEGLTESVVFKPNLTHAEKITFLSGLTVLSVPATYGEAFGLYVLEALAAGVPVVQPDHAAFPEILGLTGGGLLYNPQIEQDLEDKLESLLLEPHQARQLGAAGRKVVYEMFSMKAMAKGVIEVMEKILKKGNDGACQWV
jgi:glycosyltransferase involved in cell wall biosynthesis